MKNTLVSNFCTLKTLGLVALVVLAHGCGGGGGASTAPGGASGNSPAPLSDGQANDIALKLWRNDDLSVHPKGSCSGCHGADFFDLARIGTTDGDLLRRATTDGASQEQAKALVQAVKAMRGEMKLPAQNARTFRPLQPGGSVLLPDLTDAPYLVAIKRDIAFGNQLKTLLPTLMSGRIDSLAKAQQARDELLDLAQGTNAAGRNSGKLTMRSLPTGVLYPRWSSDVHHGADEGTFNDWTADIAHDAKPEFKAAWQGLQTAYLANPSNENFWRMYYSARDMTQLPLLGTCTTIVPNSAACGITDDFNKHKFLSAMMGQHLMRMQHSGKLDTFAQGAIAFSYLDTDPAYSYMKANNNNLAFLPSPLWEVGDNGRILIENTSSGTFKENLKRLGYPEFAQNSVGETRLASDEETALRMAWFWIGFTFDPSLSRTSAGRSQSNATRVGEYMVGTLIENRYFNHQALTTLMRLATKGSLPQANVMRGNSTATLTQLTPKYLMEYGYSWAYGRLSIKNLWNEDKFTPIPQTLKDQSAALYGMLTGNGLRMSLYLQTHQLNQTGANALTAGDASSQLGQLNGWLNDKINPSSGATIKGAFCPMYQHFKDHQLATLADDEALLDTLRVKLGITTKIWLMADCTG
jgi:hypothetical protein